MKRLLLLFALCVGPVLAADEEKRTLVLAFGAPGESEIQVEFLSQFVSWSNVAKKAGLTPFTVNSPLLDPINGVDDDTSKESQRAASTDPLSATTSYERLKRFLAVEQKDGTAELWLVLIGHGTFDGKEAKFNLAGPDVSATELAEWLKPFKRPLIVIATASASAPFLIKLTAPGRVVVSSTRSGNEHNYARFGKFFAEAIADPTSDLDKDGQVSLLEAFLSGSRHTTEFYKTEGRLATEHALLDDNGDGLGTPADWFHGVRATKRAKDGATLDGTRAHQFHLVRSEAEQQLPAETRARRDALELQIARLRDAKAKLGETKYYAELEKLLLELAGLYEGT